VDSLAVGAECREIHLHGAAPITPCTPRRQFAQAGPARPLSRKQRCAAFRDSIDQRILASNDVPVLRTN
jgi:hypothetical protein